MQVLPSKELFPFIKHYLFLENTGGAIKRLRLFSDGNTGIVFSSGEKLIADFNKINAPDYLPASFFYGHISEFRDLYAAGNTALLVVVFYPWGITKITGVPAVELQNKVIAIEDIFGWQAIELEQNLHKTPCIDDKFHLLNRFFIQLADQKKIHIHELVEPSLKLIFNNKGAVPSAQLEKFTGYTERYIERKFMESIGTTPKKFGNIVKLHHFLGRLRENTQPKNLTSLACETGYADQSHLIKTFKKQTGITPVTYLHKSHKLSVNFIELDVVHRNE